jgi:hypothetical protein
MSEDSEGLYNIKEIQAETTKISLKKIIQSIRFLCEIHFT